MHGYNLETHFLSCPYCGETIEILIDYSIGSQVYTEDCSVCCQPMVINIKYNDDEKIEVTARREND